MSLWTVTDTWARASRPMRISQAALGLVAVAAICAYGLILNTYFLAGNVDVAWLIVAGSRLLDGAALHVDILETNPPLSIALYLPFVALERGTGIAAELWLRSTVVALVPASLWFSWRILSKADPLYRQERFIWIAPLASAVLLVLFPDQFGQREQFTLIALLPWLALQAARDRSPGYRAGTPVEVLVAGLGAAFVVSIKLPYYALALGLPALAAAFQRRSLRPLFVTENLIGAAVASAYVLYLLAFDQAYIELFRTLLAPLYLPLREPLSELFWKPVGLGFTVCAAMIIAGGPKALHRDVRLLFLASAGFVPAYVMMGKGWTYHAWPFLALGMIAVVLQVLWLDRRLTLQPVRRATLLIAIAYVVWVPAMAQWMVHRDGDLGPFRVNTRAAAVIRAALDRPTIANLAARPQPAHPLARMIDGRYVSRHPSAWAIGNAQKLILETDDPAKRARLAALRDSLIAEFAAEIAEKRPDLIVYEARQLDFWRDLVIRNPAIARELSGYRLLHSDATITYLVRADIPHDR